MLMNCNSAAAHPKLVKWQPAVLSMSPHPTVYLPALPFCSAFVSMQLLQARSITMPNKLPSSHRVFFCPQTKRSGVSSAPL